LKFFFIPNEEKILIAKDDLFRNFISYPIIVVAIAISSITYYIWGILLLKKYVKKIKTYFSQISHIDLKWLKILLLAAINSYGIIPSLYVIDIIHQFTKPGTLHAVSFTIGAVYILFLGI